ncbi:hypothetical protein J23TS9_46900 [Paenibacillus sp. J23TS9]|uniref:hypothetical protein n=1 Tax=Paenibacillus sp. J23TS9 TaxID=2807193 RepID=UPI001B1A45F9|nr:hypothetical protein [Paenibacillus sp. J23TS9]GIP29560.1 hypothetical protein J23TS9_46900 [Paenibacillus sp. J23TS9]
MNMEEEQKQQAIPAEDEEGNFKLLDVERILSITSEIEDDEDSAAIFHYEDGKTYKYVHSEKAMKQFSEWIQQGEG